MSPSWSEGGDHEETETDPNEREEWCRGEKEKKKGILAKLAP